MSGQRWIVRRNPSGFGETYLERADTEEVSTEHTVASGSVAGPDRAPMAVAIVTDREPETLAERAAIVQWLEDLAESMRDRGYAAPIRAEDR